MEAHSRFEAELQVFEAHRATWARDHREQYVVIRAKQVLGFYPDFERALEAGLQKYEMGEFLVKQIFSVEPVYAIF